ncbi:acetylxylan esterase [Pseudalkalibacillus sp. A8]|uniref:acetylxylan esterase n=1 Tax=Pseudalkalibacillus sp. A8 TaxID=3382641 RepID=UPI0038B4D758
MGRQIGDYQLEELTQYRPCLTRQPDFLQYWQDMKQQLSPKVKVDLEKQPYDVKGINLYKGKLLSWDATPLGMMVIEPNTHQRCCTVVVCFHGYTGDYGYPHFYLKYALQGMTVVSFDVRGQGFTPDYALYSNGHRIPGWMLKGIEEPNSYYYTNIYRDLIVALNWVKESFNADLMIVEGSSQGGGLALAAGALCDHVDVILAGCPFLANFERAFQIAMSGPHMEIVNFFKTQDPQYTLKDQIFITLSYIDVMNFAPLISCPVLLSAGLEDSCTPPSTIYAIYNHLESEVRQLEVYPQHGHEHIPDFEEKKLSFLSNFL